MNKIWRLGHRLSHMGGVPRIIYRGFELLNHLMCSCSVSIHAEIGEGTVFFHRGIGCVVHPRAVIGKKCKIFQGVTLGSKWSDGECAGEAPQVGDNVMIGAGAVVLGNIHIGNNAIIGANAVVNQDIPSGAIAVGIPAQIRTR